MYYTICVVSISKHLWTSTNFSVLCWLKMNVQFSGSGSYEFVMFCKPIHSDVHHKKEFIKYIPSQCTHSNMFYFKKLLFSIYVSTLMYTQNSQIANQSLSRSQFVLFDTNWNKLNLPWTVWNCVCWVWETARSSSGSLSLQGEPSLAGEALLQPAAERAHSLHGWTRLTEQVPYLWCRDVHCKIQEAEVQHTTNTQSHNLHSAKAHHPQLKMTSAQNVALFLILVFADWSSSCLLLLWTLLSSSSQWEKGRNVPTLTELTVRQHNTKWFFPFSSFIMGCSLHG